MASIPPPDIGDATPRLSKDEIEELDYYDLMAYVGVPYFHWGGMDATETLATLCGVDRDARVLMVGCGTGVSACHLAKAVGCQVVGVDVGKLMISRATERAEEWEIADRVHFAVGDAYALPFATGAFDAVITEFVTIFLDQPRALAEYARVVAPGGAVGVNELFARDDMPEDARDVVTRAQTEFEQSVGLPLNLVPPAEWQSWFAGAGLAEVHHQEVEAGYSLGEYAKNMGGMTNMVRVLSRTLYYMSSSPTLRKKLMPVGRVKDMLMKNRLTRDHVGALLCVGRVPA